VLRADLEHQAIPVIVSVNKDTGRSSTAYQINVHQNVAKRTRLR